MMLLEGIDGWTWMDIEGTEDGMVKLHIGFGQEGESMVLDERAEVALWAYLDQRRIERERLDASRT